MAFDREDSDQNRMDNAEGRDALLVDEEAESRRPIEGPVSRSVRML